MTSAVTRIQSPLRRERALGYWHRKPKNRISSTQQVMAFRGAVLSFMAMLLGKRTGWFSIVGVSVLGGVLHNIGQILVAMMVVETFYVGYYIPFLIVAGTVTGAGLGSVAMELVPYLRKVSLERGSEDTR